MYKFGYVILEKETGRCFQTIQTNNGSWSINNSTHFSMMVDITHVEKYLDKYFYDNTWWRREWIYEEVTDEEGNTYQR